MGNLRAVPQKTTTPAPKTPQQHFNAYCRAIQKQQQRIDTLKQQQGALLIRFQEELLPIEQQLAQLVVSKTERLLSFTGRKSLTPTQHGELIDWVSDELDGLEYHPFVDQDSLTALRDKLMQASAIPEHVTLSDDELACMRALLADEFDFIHHLSDEELGEMMRDPAKLKEKMAAEQEDSEDEEADFSFFDGRDEEIAEQEQQQREMNTLFSISVANRMYKRLAMLLHPDRETDEAAKQEKHKLMLTLTKARKTQDIWTILSLYQQYVDSETEFDANALSALNPLLVQRVEVLKREFNRLNNDAESLEGRVWSILGATTQAGIERKLAKHRRKLQAEITEEAQMLNQLTSLKVLKYHLTARRQASAWFL